MRSSDAYLVEIVEAARRIATYIEGLSAATFLVDQKTRAAVVREIEIIGEAARQLPEDFRKCHPEVRWAELGRLRNFYIHAYHAVDYTLVWRTATSTIPRVADTLRPLTRPGEAASE